MSYGSKFFNKSSDYKPLYRTLINEIGEEKAVKVFKFAGDELDNIMHEFTDVPKGERNHTDNYIFPRVAMYRVLKKELGDNALAMIDELVNIQGEKMGQLLRKFTSLPYMERLFLMIFASMAKNMFGAKNGFAQEFFLLQKIW